jgi:hypothetical protein
VSGLAFQIPERQRDSGYVCTIDRLCFGLRDEGFNATGARMDALFVYPPGRPELGLRICGGATAMKNLDLIYDGYTTPEAMLLAAGTPIPTWISER